MSLSKKVTCTLVLAFFYVSNNLGLFRTLVQVLMNTQLMHFTINRPVSLLGECVCTIWQIYTYTYICIRLW
jgi:hypothetical protein